MESKKWQLENLIKNAFERTKDRFLSYFLTWLLSFALGAAIVVGLLLFLGLIAVLYVVTKSVLLVSVLGILVTIGFYVALIYVCSWISLATVSVIINEEKMGAGEIFHKVKPRVWGYFWMNLLAFLFMLGLLPFGILSFSIVFILWSLWSSFMTFVYLTQKKKGLQNLWIAREMFRQKAWGIFGRMLLVGFAVFAISFLLSFSMKNSAGAGLSMLFSLVATPFALSFNFEMFKLLKVPTGVKTPTLWVVFSVIGWVLTVVLTVGIVALVISQFGTLMQKAEEAKQMNDFRRFDLQQNNFNYPTY